jgi:hypothetical protein
LGGRSDRRHLQLCPRRRPVLHLAGLHGGRHAADRRDRRPGAAGDCLGLAWRRRLAQRRRHPRRGHPHRQPGHHGAWLVRRRPNADYLRLCERILADGSGLRHGGSGALGLLDVAIGRLDGYAELHLNPWDVAAALVTLREAGARVSDFFAGDGASIGNGIVVCAPGLADAWSDLPGVPRLA